MLRGLRSSRHCRRGDPEPENACLVLAQCLSARKPSPHPPVFVGNPLEFLTQTGSEELDCLAALAHPRKTRKSRLRFPGALQRRGALISGAPAVF